MSADHQVLIHGLMVQASARDSQSQDHKTYSEVIANGFDFLDVNKC